MKHHEFVQEIKYSYIKGDKEQSRKKGVTRKNNPGIKMILDYKPNHEIFNLGVKVILKILLSQTEEWGTIY